MWKIYINFLIANHKQLQIASSAVVIDNEVLVMNKTLWLFILSLKDTH